MHVLQCSSWQIHWANNPVHFTTPVNSDGVNCRLTWIQMSRLQNFYYNSLRQIRQERTSLIILPRDTWPAMLQSPLSYNMLGLFYLPDHLLLLESIQCLTEWYTVSRSKLFYFLSSKLKPHISSIFSAWNPERSESCKIPTATALNPVIWPKHFTDWPMSMRNSTIELNTISQCVIATSVWFVIGKRKEYFINRCTFSIHDEV